LCLACGLYFRAAFIEFIPDRCFEEILAEGRE